MNINSTNFNKKFKVLSKSNKSRNIVKNRFDMESIKLEFKADFLISSLLSYGKLYNITYKILFWEKNESLNFFFSSNFPKKPYIISKDYKNGKLPGVIFIDDTDLDINFLKVLLNNHFNYEMAKEPSLNVRIQISTNINKHTILLDVYDDRGFDEYILN